MLSALRLDPQTVSKVAANVALDLAILTTLSTTALLKTRSQINEVIEDRSKLVLTLFRRIKGLEHATLVAAVDETADEAEVRYSVCAYGRLLTVTLPVYLFDGHDIEALYEYLADHIEEGVCPDD